MPVHNIVTDRGLGVVTLCRGVLGGEEFIEAIRARYEPEEALRMRRYFLTDHTGVEDFAMGTDHIIALTRITTAASKIHPHAFMASVVPKDLGFGIARMWQGYAFELAWPLRMCRRREEAERWLRQSVGVPLSFR